MITVVSLFSGAVDGLAIAFQQAGAVVTHHVEIDAWCCDVLARNFPRSAIINKDVRYVTARNFPAPVDVLIGGPPCQGFSVAGSRLGLADERNLWPEMARLVRAKRPRAVIVENVPGSDSGGLIDAVRGDLENEGYATASFFIPASVFGAPHERYRVFVVGVLADGECQRHESARALAVAASDAHWNTAPYQSCRGTVSDDAVADRQVVGNARRSGLQKRCTTAFEGHARHAARRSAAWRRAWLSQSSLGGAAHGRAPRLDSPAIAAFPGFPAGQGTLQYDYEPPRVVADKPRDHAARIRALGNAVVWQQVYPLARALVEWLEGVS